MNQLKKMKLHLFFTCVAALTLDAITVHAQIVSGSFTGHLLELDAAGLTPPAQITPSSSITVAFSFDLGTPLIDTVAERFWTPAGLITYNANGYAQSFSYVAYGLENNGVGSTARIGGESRVLRWTTLRSI